jgi:tryptophanase
MELPAAEPYKIKMVEPIYRSTRKEREQWIREAKYNLFNLRSEQVYIDLLTDSGTGAMSDRQWAAVMTGDESYAGSSSFYHLKETISLLFGFDYFLPTHQGRAAENVLFSVLVKEGNIIPGNSHFDTTKGHIEFRQATAADCTIYESLDPENLHPFKGNVDLDQLKNVLEAHARESIPFIILTLTCNSSGGQPVSMQNIREVKALADQYGIPLVFDSARFAENAWFIAHREAGYERKTIQEIVLEMFSYADAMTMSSKKDGIVNIGGFIATRKKEWYDQACTFNIMFEGFVTYGGMAGRDMNALAVGLMEVLEDDYLTSRIGQVQYLGEQLSKYGISVQKPYGGHAIFVDAKAFLPNVCQEEFIAQTLCVELYLESGVRAVEVGTLMADRDPITRENRYPQLEFMRLAIPRRVYTNLHLDVVATALKNVYDRRLAVTSGYKIVMEAPILRHFTIELERVVM